MTGPVTVVESYPPGHAVVGGPCLAGNSTPGYAVVGEGTVRRWLVQIRPRSAFRGPASPTGMPPGWPRPDRGRAGAYDPAVMPSSMIPAQTALSNPSAGRPHVISHLFGIGGISRHRREARQERDREAHAAISYSPPNEPVNELPASMVYGKGH